MFCSNLRVLALFFWSACSLSASATPQDHGCPAELFAELAGKEPASAFDLSHVDASALGEHIFAVHATDEFPEKGILRAGLKNFRPSSTDKESEEIPSFRPTVHFSLGELVRPHHGRVSWEKKRYAIVTPLRSILDQTVNLSPLDTFVVGDLRLPRNSVLLVPFEEVASAKSRIGVTAQVIGYDSSKTSLRATIDQVIRTRGGWPVQMENDNPENSAPAKIGDTNINHPDFFGPLLEKYPHLAYGTHVASDTGIADSFGSIDQAVQKIVEPYEKRRAVSSEYISLSSRPILLGWTL